MVVPTVGGEGLGPETNSLRSSTDRMTPERTRNEVSQIRALRSQGIELSEEQREKLREYYRPHRQKQTCIYLKQAREAEWKALAGECGTSFSQWIQDRVAEAMAGPGPREVQLVAENESLREELQAMRGVNGKLSMENERLGQRMRNLEDDLMDSMEKVLAMVEATE